MSTTAATESLEGPDPIPSPGSFPGPDAAPGSARNPLLRAYRKEIGLLLMALPVAVYFVVFHYVPMVGLIIAFKQFSFADGVLGSPWSGLTNLRNLFGGTDFPLALRNTVVISLLRLAFGFTAPILLALMLNEVRLNLARSSLLGLMFIPHFLSWVVLGGILLMLLGSSGPINGLITSAGGDPIPFLTSDGWFVGVIVASGVWQSVGYGAVIYIAALAGIDESLYEAAVIDGANRWKQTLHITLPSLAPTIVVLLILNLGHVLTAGFDQIYNLYNPLVYDVSDIIETFVLRRMLLMDFGLAASAGLFKSVVGLVLIVVVNKVARRVSNGELGAW